MAICLQQTSDLYERKLQILNYDKRLMEAEVEYLYIMR